MKVSWCKKKGYLVAHVESLFTNRLYLAWKDLEDRLYSAREIHTDHNVLTNLAKRFTWADDLRNVHFDGATLKSEALCPASAWLFNRSIETLVLAFNQNVDNFQTVDIKTLDAFGFQSTSKKRSENSFLQSARAVGLDIIRPSAHIQFYIIRNTMGEQLSVFKQFTDRTSFLSTQLATNKYEASELLYLAGLPTPKTFIVSSENIALRRFKQLRLQSAVIKPNKTDFGVGVHTNIRRKSELVNAFRAASKHGQVILQEHIEGQDFRILVVDGKVLGVTTRRPFSVQGDGLKTIKQLMQEKIKYRADHPFYSNFNNISVDSPDIKLTLKRQALDLDSIPDVGKTVKLRANANVSSGGEHEDVTALCHEEVKLLACECAQLFKLDVAGVDYISNDISSPWTESGGMICEINPTPALSVPGVQEAVFSRFNQLETQTPQTNNFGDVLYLNDCDCDKQKVFLNLWSDLSFENLTNVSEKKYFFQSYLTKKNGRFVIILNREIIKSFGLVNANIRTVALCKNCSDSDGDLKLIKTNLANDAKIQFI